MKQLFAILLFLCYAQFVTAQYVTSDSLLTARKAHIELLKAKAKQHKTQTKSNWEPTPLPGSIEINRNPVYDTFTPQQYLEEVFVKSGACISIENVQYRGGGWNGMQWDNITDAKTLGYFNKGTSNFPLAEGLLMTTGSITDYEGPNNQLSNGYPTNTPIDDADLASLISGTVKDVVVLEFDFTPVSDTIEFRYIFASEEYPYYVNSIFNDVFGFFINEVGSPVKTNIARLPSTHTSTDVVSINNVNNGLKWTNTDYTPGDNPSNSQYFISNLDDSATTEFNGYTVALTAKYAVDPCKKYHLKLALGNTEDYSVQSGVFLEANSFNAGSRIEHHINGNAGIINLNQVYEGCGEKNVIRVMRSGNPSLAETVAISYSGTATNGVDYKSNGAALPTSIVIPAGDMYVDIVYEAIDNGIADSGKYFDITLACPCSAMTTFSLRIYIYEIDSFIGTPTSTCSSIKFELTGGTGFYAYSIDRGSNWQSSNIFSGLAPGTYEVWASDLSGCFGPAADMVTVASKPVSAGSNQAQCGNNVFTMSGTPTLAGETGMWTVVGADPGVVINNPLLHNTGVTVPMGQKVTLKWTISYGTGCVASANVELSAGGLNVTTSIIGALCSKKYDVEAIVIPSGGSYQYSIDNGVNWQASNTFSNVSLGNYTVTVKTADNSCQNTATVNLTGGFDIVVNTADIECGEVQTGKITIETNPKTGTYEYSIDGGVNWQTSPLFTGLSAGTYNVVVKNNVACTNTKQVTINNYSTIAMLTTSADNVCYGDTKGLIEINATGGNGVYQYSIDNGLSYQPGNKFNQLTANTYSIVVKDGKDCKTTGSVVISQANDINFDESIIDNTCNAQITFNNVTGGYGNYQYSIDNGASWQATDVFNNLTGGNYSIIVKDLKNCKKGKSVELSTSYMVIEPDELPIFKINKPYSVTFQSSARPPITWISDSELPDGLHLSLTGELYGTPSIQKSRTYDLTVKATDMNGCIVSKTYQLKGELLVPHIITPNGDGKNDYFMEGFHVIIFDRLGLQLFEGEDGWDGTHNGQTVAPDTYYYIIFDGNEKRTGYISVLK